MKSKPPDGSSTARPPRLSAAARVVRVLALSLWLGGLAMALAAAPIINAKLPADEMMATAIALAVQHTISHVGLGLGLVALAAEAVLFFRAAPDAPASWRRYVSALGLMAALLVALALVAYFGPRLLDLREQIGDFSPKAAASPARQVFMQLRHLCLALQGVQILLVATALVASLSKARSA